MFCSKCGTQLNESSAFCPRCGTSVAPAMEKIAEDVSPKSRLATSLLAWFLGQFGAHRFYTGRIRTAVLMLTITIVAYAVMIGSFIGTIASVSDDYWWTPFFGGMVLGGSLHFAVWVWYIIDFIIAVTGNFRDSQGKVIKKW